MATLTVRNLPGEVHRTLKLRAGQNGRTAEPEVWAILGAAVRPEGHVSLCDELAACGQLLGGLELDITRDPNSAEPATFE